MPRGFFHEKGIFETALDRRYVLQGAAAEFARFIAQEQQRWKTVVDRARIKPD